MAIKSEIRGKSDVVTAVRFDNVMIDRLIIESDDLIDAAKHNLRMDPESEEWYIPLSQIYRLKDHIRRVGDSVVPEWMQEAVEDSYWAYTNRRYHHNDSVWMVEDRLVFNSHFILTLSHAVQNIPSSSCEWSHDCDGWVLQDPVVDNGALNDLLGKYNIHRSTRLGLTMEGTERWKEILQKHVEGAKEDGLRIPDRFPTERTLKPHQEEGVLSLASLGRGILADQVGLGKGGEFISGFLSVVQYDMEHRGLTEEDVYPCVVVTTSSMKEEIAEEIVKWKNDAKVQMLYGRKEEGISPEAEFVVLNVDILNARLSEIISAEPRGFITDEAHMLKNPTAQRTKAAQQLANWLWETHGDDSYMVMASGTPFTNRPAELWSLICILQEDDFFGSYARKKIGQEKMKVRTRNGFRWVPITDQRAFETRWCDGQYNDYGDWINGGTSNTAELNRLLLNRLMVRRRKSDVLHPLPHLDERIELMEMSEAHREEYADIQFQFAEWLKERARETAEEEGLSISEAIRVVYAKLRNAGAVMQMTAMRQAVARGKIEGTKNFIHRFMSGEMEYTPDEGPDRGKVIRVGDDPARRKLIVFAYHKEVQQMLIEDPDLDQYGKVWIRSGEDPQEAKRLFQEDDDTRLIICYSGAREGHTLTAAKDIFLVEIPFVPSWIVQMAGRCWARLSELYPPHEATLHYGVVPNTIDSALMHKVKLKKASFNAIIDGEDMEELEETDDDGVDQAEIMLQLMASGGKKVGIAG